MPKRGWRKIQSVEGWCGPKKADIPWLIKSLAMLKSGGKSAMGYAYGFDGGVVCRKDVIKIMCDKPKRVRITIEVLDA